MMLVLLSSFGVLFLGSIGAFLLLAPILSIATSVCVLTGLMGMFALGVQVGNRMSLSPAAEPSQIAS